jgi:hypothetical protein
MAVSFASWLVQPYPSMSALLPVGTHLAAIHETAVTCRIATWLMASPAGQPAASLLPGIAGRFVSLNT